MTPTKGCLPLPYLYPTAEGGVRAEWSLKPFELSCDIDIDTQVGIWHALNLDNDSDQSRTLDLANTSDWEWLVAEVRQRAGVNV